MLPAASALFKPCMQISRTRLARTRSHRGMHWMSSLAAELGLSSVRRYESVVGLPQAVLLSLFRPRGPAGALRSTGVTPLHRYYGPLRLPTWPTGGYCFPSVVDPGSPSGSPSRVSQVPARSVDARRPVSPRGPIRCMCSLLHGRYQVSPLLEG